MPPIEQLPRPTQIRSPHGADWFELEWAAGHRVRLPNRILRGYCPCASCQGHGGTLRFRTEGATEIRDIEAVGNYAIRLIWSDTHGTGLYSFELLKRLCDLYERHGEALPERYPVLPARTEPGAGES